MTDEQKRAEREFIAKLMGWPTTDELPEPEDSPPDFDGGPRGIPTQPTDPEAEHNELMAHLAGLPKREPEEW